MSVMISIFSITVTVVVFFGVSSYTEENNQPRRVDLIAELRGDDPVPLEHLPEAVVVDRLKTLIDMIDNNHDQLVKPSEMHQWINQQMEAEARVKSLFRFYVADDDGNGRVTWQERIGGHEYKMAAGGKKWGYDKELFDFADTDGDGELTAEEYRVFSFPAQFPASLTLFARQEMSQRDANEDGRLTFREFIQESMPTGNYNLHLAERERFDALIDQDDDGCLDLRELTDWLREDFSADARRESVSLLHQLDDNIDGAMSPAELLAHKDIFLRSEATNYGKLVMKLPATHDEL